MVTHKKRDLSETLSLMKSFREERNQTQSSTPTKSVTSRGYTKQRRKQPSYYDVYKRKMEHLTDANVDKLTTRDLVYHFREKSVESGNNYVIANFKRDMGVVKKAVTRYSIREVLLMIEFLFDSEQDYLDCRTLQPTILVTNWTNTLISDAEDWLEDRYIPRSKKKHSKREWVEPVNSDDTTIGDWGF